MSAGELSFNSMIELSRLMVALKYIDSDVSADDIWLLASAAGCG